MPEGPEVETVRRTLAPRLVGARLGGPSVSPLPLRTPISGDDLAFLAGRDVVDVGRHGKTLWIDVCGGGGVVVRLGMTGQLTLASSSTPLATHTHVRVPLVDPAHEGMELRFRDPRRFGEVVPYADAAGRATLIDGLGPDGLTLDDGGRAAVAAALRRTSRAIKEALLDQRVVAGVGNIYAAEACFLAGLAPTRKGTSLSRDEASRLVLGVEETLAQGVRHRGTSFSDYVDGDGERGDNARHLHVFQREGEPCRRCGGAIVRLVQGARSTFWCPGCQRGRRRRR